MMRIPHGRRRQSAADTLADDGLRALQAPGKLLVAGFLQHPSLDRRPLLGGQSLELLHPAAVEEPERLGVSPRRHEQFLIGTIVVEAHNHYIANAANL
jgi:hypothetical protein